MFARAVSVSSTALARRVPPCGGLAPAWRELGLPESCPLAWLDGGAGGACCASAAVWWAVAGIPARARPWQRLAVAGGGFVRVDADVAARLAGLRLYSNSGGYARYFRGAGVRVDLHRAVMHPGPDLEVHHLGAVRDNRRCRLAVLSRTAHRRLEPRRGPGVSGWRGVYPAHRRWYVHLHFEGRVCWGGSFASPYEAALARDAAVEARGAAPLFARNFPVTIPSARLRQCLLRQCGQSFRVVFRKRTDGTLRVMNCRLPLPLEVAARPPQPDLRRLRLVSVIDTDAQEYRSIPLEGVLCFQRGGTWCRVLRPAPRAARSAPGATTMERSCSCEAR